MLERNLGERTRTQTAFEDVPTSVVDNNRRAIVYQPGLKKKKEDEDETVSPHAFFPHLSILVVNRPHFRFRSRSEELFGELRRILYSPRPSEPFLGLSLSSTFETVRNLQTPTFNHQDESTVQVNYQRGWVLKENTHRAIYPTSSRKKYRDEYDYEERTNCTKDNQNPVALSTFRLCQPW
ncbi:hypothetical protein V3481_017142 [Fusarium oxysporum f. sp. vasinfectum]